MDQGVATKSGQRHPFVAARRHTPPPATENALPQPQQSCDPGYLSSWVQGFEIGSSPRKTCWVRGRRRRIQEHLDAVHGNGGAQRCITCRQAPTTRRVMSAGHIQMVAPANVTAHGWRQQQHNICCHQQQWQASRGGSNGSLCQVLTKHEDQFVGAVNGSGHGCRHKHGGQQVWAWAGGVGDAGAGGPGALRTTGAK